MLRSLVPVLVLAAGFLSAPALAQSPEEPPAPVERYAERTIVDFDPLALGGELQRPSIVVLHERQRAQFAPLFPIRLSFEAEMASSVEEVR